MVPIFGTADGGVIRPGSASGTVSFMRASRAYGFDASAALFRVEDNAPRFVGTAQRLLIEEPGTNGVRNPRAEGGGPGVIPTYWSDGWGGGAETLTSQIIGTGTEAGIPYLDYRLSGTPTASRGDRAVSFEVNTAIPAATGDIWTASLFLKYIAGSPSGFSNTLRFFERTSAGAQVAAGSSSALTLSGPGVPLSQCRTAFTRTLSGGATVAAINFGLGFTYTSGTPFEVTLRAGAPQLEIKPFASSPILPEAATLAATTRAAETATVPASRLFPAAAGTVSAAILLPAVTTASQVLWQVDDGTDANRIVVDVDGASALRLRVIVGGSVTATIAGPAVAAGTLARVGASFAAGRQALAVNGTTAGTAAAALPSLATMRIGRSVAGEWLNGEIGPLNTRPAFSNPGALQALTA